MNWLFWLISYLFAKVVRSENVFDLTMTWFKPHRIEKNKWYWSRFAITIRRSWIMFCPYLTRDWGSVKYWQSTTTTARIRSNKCGQVRRYSTTTLPQGWFSLDWSTCCSIDLFVYITGYNNYINSNLRI